MPGRNLDYAHLVAVMYLLSCAVSAPGWSAVEPFKVLEASDSTESIGRVFDKASMSLTISREMKLAQNTDTLDWTGMRQQLKEYQPYINRYVSGVYDEEDVRILKQAYVEIKPYLDSMKQQLSESLFLTTKSSAIPEVTTNFACNGSNTSCANGTCSGTNGFCVVFLCNLF